MNREPGGINPTRWMRSGQLKNWLAQTGSSFPDAFLNGLEHYLAGQHFDAHELWEEVWRATPTDQPDRVFFHACIQMAVAWHHHGKGNPTGARNLLLKAMAKFDSLNALPRYQFMAEDFKQARQAILPQSD